MYTYHVQLYTNKLYKSCSKTWQNADVWPLPPNIARLLAKGIIRMKNQPNRLRFAPKRPEGLQTAGSSVAKCDGAMSHQTCTELC